MPSPEGDYRSLAENLPGAVYRVYLREKWRTHFFNDRVEEMTGYEAGELTFGQVCSIDPLIVEEDRQAVIDVVNRSIRERHGFTLAYRIRHKNGAIRHFEERGRPIYGEDGEPLYIDGVVLDVSDRAFAERSLKESEERFRQLAENIDEVFFLITPDWNEVLYISPAYERVWGRSCRSLRDSARSWLEAVVEEDRAAVIASVEQGIGGDVPKVFPEYRILRSDGKQRWVQARCWPILDHQGEVCRVAGIAEDITDRKHAEETRQREQSLLESVIQTTDVMLVLLDPQFNFIWVNPAYAETCRMTPEEMVGKNHFALYPDAENEAIFRKVRDTGEVVFHKDKPFVFPDQPERGVTYWDWSLMPVRDASGTVGSLVFSLRETTRFKHAELALQRQTAVVGGVNRIVRKALRAANAEQLGQICLEVAEEITQSRIAFVGEIHRDTDLLDDIAIDNPAWDACEMNPADGTRRPPMSFKIRGLYGRVILDGNGFFTNDPASHPDRIELPPGHPPLKSFLGVPLVRNGQTIGMVAVGNRPGGYGLEQLEALAALAPTIVEAFDRQRAEQALRESERRYRELVQDANSAIIRWKRDGTMTFINEYAERLFGYRMDEIVGQSVGILLPGWASTGTDLTDLVHSIVAHPERYRSNVNENVCRDGRRLWMIWTNRPVFDERGELAEILAIGSDITDRKRAEEALRTLNDTLERKIAERTALAERRARDLRRLAAELSNAEHRERARLARLLHDGLQQLLVAARLRVPMIVTNRKKQNREAADQLERLLTEAIQASRNLAMELSPFMLQHGTLVEALERLGEWCYEKHGLSIAFDMEGAPPVVPEHVAIFLFQSVRELLFNVVKHSGKRDACLRLFLQDGHLLLQVEDDGERFDPQAVEAQLRQPESFGLFNIRERVEALGGRLEVERASGGGACFRLIVPIQRGGEAAPLDAGRSRVEIGTAPVTRSRVDGEVVRLLVVDDHAVVRDGLVGILSRQPGFEVVGEAADGEQAVRQARTLRPDAIIMDIDMPTMDGIESTRQIKAWRPETIVIGLSLHQEETVVRAMTAAGADAYVSKHAAAKDLVETALRACGLKSAP